jgi:hypothetical protein
MAKFQLCSRNEYNHVDIHMTSEKLDEVMAEAKRRVTDANVNNSLTMTDREKNWEAYYPVLTPVEEKDQRVWMFFYGGKGAMNKDLLYAVDKKTGDINQASEAWMKSLKVEIYLGDISTDRKQEKSWMAKDIRQRPIDRLDHPELADKTMFYVKLVV